jgi:hypothetical protein
MPLCAVGKDGFQAGTIDPGYGQLRQANIGGARVARAHELRYRQLGAGNDGLTIPDCHRGTFTSGHTTVLS